MTSSKVEREIMLDTDQMTEFNMKRNKNTMDSTIDGFSMKLNPGRPDFSKVSNGNDLTWYRLILFLVF